MTLSAKIATAISLHLSNQNDLSAAAATVELGQTTSWADGTAAGQAHLMFASSRTLAGSASESLDLSGGGLLDGNEQALTFAKVVAIYVKASANNTDDVLVGGAGSNAFVGPFGSTTDKIHVKPGCEFLVYARDTGWAVTSGTGDLLKVADSGSAGVAYDIVILGA